MEEEKRIDFKSITMGRNLIKHRSVAIITWGSTSKRIDVGKKNTEIGAKTLNNIQLTRGREVFVVSNQRVNTVENILLFNAEEVLIGKIK